MHEQYGTYPIGEGDETKLRYYLRAEAVSAVIHLMDCDDPAETFDRVMLIHQAKTDARV